MSKELERHSTNMAIQALRTGLRTLADYIGPKCRNAVEVAMATTANDDAAQHPEQAEDDIKKLIVLLRHGDAMPGEQDLAADHLERLLKAEQAEGAQGERERFEVEMLELCLPIERDSHGAYVSDHVRHLWSGWELRAALAQPSPEPCHCQLGNCLGAEEGRWCKAQPSPAPEHPLVSCLRENVEAIADAAIERQRDSVAPELERPEVVARVDGSDEDWFIQPEDETELHDEGLLFAGCELGRMVDFDRIVTELKDDVEQFKTANRDLSGRLLARRMKVVKLMAEVAELKAQVAQAGQVPEALREGFMTSCSGGGKYEVKIQFSNLKDAQESHNFLVKLLAAAPAQGGV